MPSVRKGKSTQGEYVEDLASVKKGDVYVTYPPNLIFNHENGLIPWVHHNVTRTPRYVGHKPDIDESDLPDNWPADWGLPQASEDDEVPVYTIDLYNPGPGRGPRSAGDWGHYQKDVPLAKEPLLGFMTGNPPELGPQIRNVVRHKQSRRDPRPKTAIGGLVHDLNRIVPNGDATTNTFFANSVAAAIAKGAVRTQAQIAQEEKVRGKTSKKKRANVFDIMD